MKKILLALDGSDHSQRATELAADIASKYNAKLILLNVIDNRPLSEAERKLAELEFSGELKKRTAGSNWTDINPAADQGVGPIFKHHAEISRIIRTTIGEGILAAAKREAEANGVEDVDLIIENGDPADVILQTAQAYGANLIVIGSRGQSDMKSLFLGSVSHKVANQSDISVITVK
ncbi:MAG: universal stress protein [Hyphomicrobiales bacterium]